MGVTSRDYYGTAAYRFPKQEEDTYEQGFKAGQRVAMSQQHSMTLDDLLWLRSALLTAAFYDKTYDGPEAVALRNKLEEMCNHHGSRPPKSEA